MTATVLALRDAAQWRWKAILPHFGIDLKFLVNRHGPCPLCGGVDRFRFDDKQGRGTFFCSQCGSGDGFMLLEKKTGKTYGDLRSEVAALSDASAQEVQKQFTYEDPAKHMRAVWRRATAPSTDGPVQRYLAKRLKGHVIGHRPAIREAKVWHPNAQRMLWCMVSQVVTPGGETTNLHLTYLTDDGDKAGVSPDKRAMKGDILAGSAIRLSTGAPVMGIAEGIETALSCEIMFGVPVWSALNAPILAKWQPPEGVKKVIVFGDNDKNYTGQAKAYALANILSIRGREVEVKFPPRSGTDWNDELA